MARITCSSCRHEKDFKSLLFETVFDYERFCHVMLVRVCLLKTQLTLCPPGMWLDRAPRSLFGLGSGHGVSKHMVVGHDYLTCSVGPCSSKSPKLSLRGRFDKNPVLGCPGDVVSDMRQ